MSFKFLDLEKLIQRTGSVGNIDAIKFEIMWDGWERLIGLPISELHI